MKTNIFKKVFLLLMIQISALYYSHAGVVNIIQFESTNNFTFGDCIGNEINFYFSGNITGYTAATSDISIVINFGDGTNTTIPMTTIDSGSIFNYSGSISHTYSTAGIMIPNIIVTAVSDGVTDTMSSSTINVLSGCMLLSGTSYNDCNHNCTYDAGEEDSTLLMLVNSIGDYMNIHSNTMGNYSFYVPTDTYFIGFWPSLCNPYGNITVTGSTSYNIAKNCNPANTYAHIGHGRLSTYCTGENINLSYALYCYTGSGYSGGDNVIVSINYGDGTINTFTANLIDTIGSYLFISGYLNHIYTTDGVYIPTITYLFPDGRTAIDHDTRLNIISTCDLVSGYLYIDANGNCVRDIGEVPLTNYLVYISGGSYLLYDYTDSTGLYSFHVPTGVSYSLSTLSSPYCSGSYTTSCPSTGSVSFTLSSSFIQDFGFSGSSSYDATIYFYNVAPRSYIRTDENSSGSIVYHLNSLTPMSGTVNMTLDPLTTFVSAIPAPSSISGSVISWNYSGLSSTDGPQYINVTFHTSPLADSFNMIDSTGDIICLDFDITPTIGDCYSFNNHEHLCIPVGRSWDPNNKEVYPQGMGSEGIIAPGTDLTYTVHFQNMGTSFARNVFVMDTLDPDLDIKTFELITSSHPVQVHWLEGNILKFAFDNIMLVDTSVSQDSSQGFFQYRIKHNATAPLGTEISNTASIYFDYNPAVVTNTTHNKLGYPNSITRNDDDINSIKIYPNPALNYAIIETNEHLHGSIEIYNQLGKLIETHLISNSKEKINLDTFVNGIYLIRLVSDTGEVISTKKLNVLK